MEKRVDAIWARAYALAERRAKAQFDQAVARMDELLGQADADRVLDWWRGGAYDAPPSAELASLVAQIRADPIAGDLIERIERADRQINRAWRLGCLASIRKVSGAARKV